MSRQLDPLCPGIDPENAMPMSGNVRICRDCGFLLLRMPDHSWAHETTAGVEGHPYDPTWRWFEIGMDAYVRVEFAP